MPHKTETLKKIQSSWHCWDWNNHYRQKPNAVYPLGNIHKWRHTKLASFWPHSHLYHTLSQKWQTPSSIHFFFAESTLIEITVWRATFRYSSLVCASHDTFFSHPPLPFAHTAHSPWSIYLPAVTHVLTFQNARKVTSRRCVPGRVDSAKKHVCHQFLHYLGQLGTTEEWIWKEI